MNAFTIKHIEQLSGVKAHTIRAWEQRYNFFKPQRSGTNIRYYTDKELSYILDVVLLNKSGYKISRISKLTSHEILNEIQELQDSHAQHDLVINKMINAMMAFDSDLFEKILNTESAKTGHRGIINSILLPFIDKAGLLNKTQCFDRGSVQLITNIIRQKLMRAIESITVLHTRTPALLFLPEDVHDELGLLCIFYLLKQSGIRTLYLGADVPYADLKHVLKIKHPGCLITHINTGNNKVERLINKLVSFTGQTPVYMLLGSTELYKKPVPPNVYFKRSVLDFLNIHI